MPLDFARLPSLHLGPMSVNGIKATVGFAKDNSWPICLIASRRQIEARSLGGGYVGNLTTEDFARNLKKDVAAGHVILARDHGGPYQRSEESGLPLKEAMDKVEQSYRTDIENGFNIIHIDPEKCIRQDDPDALEKFTELTQELLSRCFAVLRKTGRKDVRFEVGSDEGVGMDFVPDQWATFLETIKTFCAAHGQPDPVAIAVPLGTKVKETENVGGLALDTKDPFWTKRVRAMKEIGDRMSVKLKLHNADYIATAAFRRYLELGVEQINVAPELGVIETRALLQFLRKNNMKNHAEAFLRIAYDSRKWERWLKPDSTATDEDKAVIAGHYVFSVPECEALMKEIRANPAAKQLDSLLISAITKGIKGYYDILEEAYATFENVSN